MTDSNINPWRDLPTAGPFVLTEDKLLVDDFNKGLDQTHPHFLQVGAIVPEAFVGAPNAPLVLLSNNPGFGKHATHKLDPQYSARMRKNLVHEPSEYPFLYLDPAFDGRISTWWKSKLKDLLAVFDTRVVANALLNVVYFPYPSRRFGHQRLRLPSQDYNFGLVKDAVRRDAAIVFMRPGKAKFWLREVPELEGYDLLFQVKNPRSPSISRRNCNDFERIVEVIKKWQMLRAQHP